MINVPELLTELCDLPGPAGFEEPVAERVSEILASCMDNVWTDVLGNVIGVRRCGKEGARKLLLDAHIDEIGLIVTGLEEGFLRVAKLGGADVRNLPSSGVMVLTEPPRYGVIGVMPPHVLKKEDSEKAIKVEDIFIDIGMAKGEPEDTVPPGTPVVLAQKTRRLGERGMYGKALDDRAGFITILRAIELLGSTKLDFDIYVMASTQEEVGTRGAAPGVYSIAPDWSFVVDVTHAKTPDSTPSETSEELGGGVVISRGPNMNSKLTEMAIRTAKEKEIKHQVNVEPGGDSGTNARVIQVSREGVATALFGIPMKYMHSTCEAISLDDLECVAQLMCETAKKLGGDES